MQKITKEELLCVENLFLKIKVANSEAEKLQAQALKINDERIGFQREMEILRNSLSKKYNLDFASPTLMILPDGTIKDTGEQPPPVNQMSLPFEEQS